MTNPDVTEVTGLDATARAGLVRRGDIAVQHDGPAVLLPLHWTPEGVPVGVHLVACWGGEDFLIRVSSSKPLVEGPASAYTPDAAHVAGYREENVGRWLGGWLANCVGGNPKRASGP